jgi:acetylornithine deacetylase/succinyl-diaminopimelate desuccinylase-like protein
VLEVQDEPMTEHPATAAYQPDDEVVDICRDLIRIDTSNYGDDSGPGERKAAEQVATLLSDVGIDAQLYEAAPGRTSLIARWGGDQSSDGALLVHGHLDVVPAQAADWQVDPFAGEVRDGYVWGRGAVDMKDFDAMLLSVVRARARAGAVPKRPLVLCFTADEEAGSNYGAHWLVDNHRDAFDGCTEAIGEVGGYSLSVGDQRVYLIETGEKGMCWMRLRVHGTAGHGSMRSTDNAVTHLAEAVARIGRHQWPVHVGQSMDQLLDVLRTATGVVTGDPDELLAAVGPAQRMLGAGIRNTTNPTMLSAGYKVNVVPGEAMAYVDGRILPGQREEFDATLAELTGERVDIEVVNDDIALETGFDGHLVDVMTRVLLDEDPTALVAPYLMSGGTDAKAWSRLGIRCFGFTPLRLPPDLDFTALFHGVDERVPVDALRFGARTLDRFLDLA